MHSLGSSSTAVEQTTLVTSFVQPTATGFSFTTINVRYNRSVTSTNTVPASPTFWTSSAMKRQSSFEITNSSFSTAKQASSSETHYSLFSRMKKISSTVTQSTSTRMESPFPVSNKILPTSSGAYETTPSKHATSGPTRTTAATTKVNIMGMKISIGMLSLKLKRKLRYANINTICDRRIMRKKRALEKIYLMNRPSDWLMKTVKL